MKAGILTFHRADNYGAVLQTYALLTTLNALGAEAEIIDYRCAPIENRYRTPLLPKLRKEKQHWFTAIKKNALLRKKKAGFAAFREKYFPLPLSVSSESEKPALEERYPLIVTGSDQIFSAYHTRGADPFYCYKKSPACRSTVVSYAASVGNIEDFIRNYGDFSEALEAYDLLSVREPEVKTVLEQLVNVPISVSLDPTLLLTSEQWEPICRPYPKAPKRFLLQYDVSKSAESSRLAERLAREKGLTLVHFDQKRAYAPGSVYAADASPEEFLWLIRNASYVVTSSFHGTVFSILFRKAFVSVPDPLRGSRITSLLGMLGLDAWRFDTAGETKAAAPDPEAVQNKLHALRESSLNYLKYCLQLAEAPTREAYPKKELPPCYVLRHTDVVRAVSQSGGAFTAFSDPVLEAGGVVYGAAMDSDFNAVHMRAETKAERAAMHGSKYVQSSLGDTFRRVKADLATGRQVLFSGTGCQILGLKKYLGREYENLLCLEILCHSVPSKLLWQDTLRALSGGKKITAAIFRDKARFGWGSHFETVICEDGTRKSGEVFKTLFYKHYILRPACACCPCKTLRRQSDLVIGDYWGIEKAAPTWKDKKGLSEVLVQSEKGQKAVDALPPTVDRQRTELTCSLLQPMLLPYRVAPAMREAFWRDYRSRGFNYVSKKYGTPSLMLRLKRLARRYLKGGR